MSRHVTFLRGMNLGRRRIKNPELCAAFEAMGFAEVGAFLASGNVAPQLELTDIGRTCGDSTAAGRSLPPRLHSYRRSLVSPQKAVSPRPLRSGWLR